LRSPRWRGRPRSVRCPRADRRDAPPGASP
jgi:hypothetical protein